MLAHGKPSFNVDFRAVSDDAAGKACSDLSDLEFEIIISAK